MINRHLWIVGLTVGHSLDTPVLYDSKDKSLLCHTFCIMKKEVDLLQLELLFPRCFKTTREQKNKLKKDNLVTQTILDTHHTKLSTKTMLFVTLSDKELLSIHISISSQHHYEAVAHSTLGDNMIHTMCVNFYLG